MNILNKKMFDVIIVGAGHAGVEATLAASKIVNNVLLITNKIDSIGELSCNPSIGGIGKGHLVKEIDAMGGYMGFFADLSGINFKKLNSSKGAAVQSTRIQVDRLKYKNIIKETLLKSKNISILQQNVTDILIKNNTAVGVVTDTGIFLYSKSIVLTLGTFLDGKIFIGELNFLGGRIGDFSSIKLSKKLREYFPVVGRLKTGTPPRIDVRSVNLNYFNVQKSDFPIPFFSTFIKLSEKIKNKNCYITYTNFLTHEIILNSINLSAIYNGSINVVGPRYCPSIEDKILRFKDKIHHQIFLEPEGLNSYEFYLNGLSTSLPVNVQLDFLKSIVGFKNVIVTRFGYAVEYDFFDPRMLKFSLETKTIKGLFFAGQINGTTGYEEAAAQGLIAGINSACFVLEKEPFILSRSDSYIGVLIDDLITKGIDEPYRIFTSRSEYRLILREDNADLRLTQKARNYGLISDCKWKYFLQKYDDIKKINFFLNKQKIRVYSKFFYKLNKFFGINIFKNYKFFDLLKCQNINYKLIKLIFYFKFSYYMLDIIEIRVKYSGYLNKQYNEIVKLNKFKNTKIPFNIDYNKISGLSTEISDKLKLIRPLTLNQATKIPGITITSILILLTYIKK